MTYLCVDAGTTMVKSVLFDEEGAELAVARQATVVTRPRPGWSEQDMYSVWDAVVHTIRSVIHATQDQGPPSLVASTAQGDGCWLVGENGRPTGPAMLWNDARASSIVDDWDQDGLLEQAFRINGNLGFAGTQSAILSWLREHDPERLERSHQALYCGGWLFSKLTGRFAVEESDAASPFLDITERTYSGQLRSLLGLEWADRLLPDILAEEQRVAPLLEGPAAELRLPPDTPVVMAPFDIPATAIGMGALEPGRACSILGTTLSTQMTLGSFDTCGTPAGMLLPMGVPGLTLRSMPAMAGADVITWGMRLIGLDDPNWLSDLAGLSVPGAKGLVFHPYLSPSGERAPFRDPQARGSIAGLSFEHERPDMARAMLEGLSFVIRDCLSCMTEEVAELRLCGGGANSDFWCQLLADVTGVPTSRSADTEIGAKGAYLTARSIVEDTSIHDLGASLVRLRDVFEPDSGVVPVYDELFADFLALREPAARSWSRLADIRNRLGTSAVDAT